MGMAFPTYTAIHLDLDITMADMHSMDIIWVIRILVFQGVIIFIQNQILQGVGDILNSCLVIIKYLEIKLTQVAASKVVAQSISVIM